MHFTEEQLKVFSEFSYDLNPLHIDKAYASKTVFGKPVVYGMASVLFAIGEWSKEKPFKLTSIKGSFKKAMHIGEEYRLEIKNSDAGATFEYFKGMTSMTKITIAGNFINEPHALTKADSSFNPLSTPLADTNSFSAPNFTYSWNQKCSEEMKKFFRLSEKQILNSQLNALLWSTYFVGMISPGKQALFSKFEFSFTENNAQGDTSFTIQDLNVEYDSRFHQFTISGKGTGITEFTLYASKRPEPVNYKYQDILKLTRNKNPFYDKKTALITGSSRGFGLALSQGLAFNGSRIFMNSFRSHMEGEQKVREINSNNAVAYLLKGDIANQEQVRSLKSELVKKAGSLDLLALNAYPHIGSQPFNQMDDLEILDFVFSSLNLVLKPLRHFLPIMNPGGVVLLISTIYIKNPEPGFSHYLAGKGSTEELLKGLSLEFKHLNFVIARLNKMLTDQTNGFQNSELQSAQQAALDLLDKIALLETQTTNYFEI